MKTGDAAIPARSGTCDPAASLRRHGKSFHFAGNFLSGAHFRDCARLYGFCRYLDDIADQSTCNEQARRVFRDIAGDLLAGSSRNPQVADFLQLAEAHAIDRGIVLELIRGLEGDLDPVAVSDWPELIRYCYRVAGTVGLLMARILGASEPVARFHAVDLGIAMQLTNIARDVAEDARAGRRYLPASLLPGVSVEQIVRADPEIRPALSRAVSRLLSVAEAYYASGEDGLVYLAPRARVAILIASRLYHAIGTGLAARGHSTWEGRTYVTTGRKISIAAGTLFEFVTTSRYKTPPGPHPADLHEALAGLPGVNRGGSAA